MKGIRDKVVEGSKLPSTDTDGLVIAESGQEKGAGTNTCRTLPCTCTVNFRAR